jgi:hypothetical protein
VGVKHFKSPKQMRRKSGMNQTNSYGNGLPVFNWRRTILNSSRNVEITEELTLMTREVALPHGTELLRLTTPRVTAVKRAML